MRLLTLVLLLAALGTPALAAQSYRNKTIMTFDPGHGTQVEYDDAAGRTWLWYPGNGRVLPGRWKIEGANACYAYGGNTYNPVTGQSGGGWECQSLKLQQSFIVDHRTGDVFGLSKSNAVPFALKPGRTTIGALLKGR